MSYKKHLQFLIQLPNLIEAMNNFIEQLHIYCKSENSILIMLGIYLTDVSAIHFSNYYRTLKIVSYDVFSRYFDN